MRRYLAIVSLMLLAGLPAYGGLSPSHRYSFAANQNANDNDTTNTANGTVVGGAIFTNNGIALNGISGYVSLPAGVVSNVTAVTIETWATFATITNDSFLFGFGNTDGSGNGENYIFCTPHGNGTRTAITGVDPGYNGEQQAAISSVLDNQSNVMVAAVFNPTANFIGLYLNGVIVASNTTVTTTMTSVSDKLSYIGHSLYTADPYLKATISEFRIYYGALTNGQIAVDTAAGPGRLVPNAGQLVAMTVSVTNMTVGSTELMGVNGNFANVPGVNLFGYGSPVVVSANTNIATVSASGLITANLPGSVWITASLGSFTSSNLLTVTFPTNLFVFNTFGDGFWTITNALNGLPLTVNANRASQEAYTNSATDQQFELLYNYQNSGFHICQHSSWQCIGTAGGGTNAGTGVTTINYSAQSSQQWYLVSAGNGLYRIVNLAGNNVLQTDNGNPATITIANPSSSSSQLWGFSYQTHYPKKGCAGYEGNYAQFGLDWAYNYNDNTGVNLPTSVDFVPMIDTEYWEPISDLQARDSGWLAQTPPAYVLGFNEPDNSGSASTNPSTNTAIADWPALMGLGIPLVGPAMQNEQDAWEYNFYQMITANGYRVDYSAVHLYVPPNASSVISDLQSEYNAYGRPVWLTEFSPVDWNGNQGWTEDDDYNFLAEFMWSAEGDDWFKRYAIFPFSGTNPNPPYTSVTAGYRGNFFQSDGATLTPYGELYSTWDGITYLQTNTPYLIHNLGTSFRLTSTNATAPQPATIYTRDSSAQWVLTPASATNYYIISLKDGRRLQNNSGTPSLAPPGTTNSTCQWWMNGPSSLGYYYIDNLSVKQSIEATGTAPAISFGMINDPAPSSATEWRLVKPYAPVAIVTATPPAVAIGYTNQSATLAWNGNGSFYNIYRSTTTGGGYVKIASLVTNLTYTNGALQNGTAYYYVVTALNILGQESAYSTEVVAHPASTTPQAVSYNLVNNSGQNGIQFNWPSDHTGWRLMMNTNGLGNPAAWVTVPNSVATNQIWLPFDPTQSNVFFQMVYP